MTIWTELLKNIEPLDFKTLNGKLLRMVYVEEDGNGLLAGQDPATNTVYIISEVIKSDQ